MEYIKKQLYCDVITLKQLYIVLAFVPTHIVVIVLWLLKQTGQWVHVKNVFYKIKNVKNLVFYQIKNVKNVFYIYGLVHCLLITLILVLSDFQRSLRHIYLRKKNGGLMLYQFYTVVDPKRVYLVDS
jgi:hypothetical protein